MELTPEQLEEARKLIAAENENDDDTTPAGTPVDDDDRLEAEIEKRLAKMKESMNAMNRKVEEERRARVKAEEAAKSLERQKMEDEGKHLELREMEVADLKSERDSLRDQLRGLTRDQKVKELLSTFEFRNDYARTTAFRDVVGELTEDEDGNWKHKTGVSVEEFVKLFAKDPNREILFKPKTNQGAGAKPDRSTVQKDSTKLTGLSTEELMRRAAEGSLGSFPL